ncbi:hypothetical protein WMY93_013407 [Mugilogobius chulae]|uniref:Uncharacterized protein n=1 Tax=Mugilogobius chulae TaxID=88201 RepID=A0AAW0P696_9GOBI
MRAELRRMWKEHFTARRYKSKGTTGGDPDLGKLWPVCWMWPMDFSQALTLSSSSHPSIHLRRLSRAAVSVCGALGHVIEPPSVLPCHLPHSSCQRFLLHHAHTNAQGCERNMTKVDSAKCETVQ